MRIWTQAKVVEVERRDGFKGHAKIWVTTGMQRVRRKRGYWRFWVWATVPNPVREGKEWVRSYISLFKKKKIFDVHHFKSLYWICYSIASVWFIYLMQGIWDPSSHTRDRTHTPCIESEILTTGLPGKYPRSSNAMSRVWGTPRSPTWRPCMPPQSLVSFSVYEWWVIIDNGYWCLLCARCSSKYFMCDN